jgi:prepilin-type N-terminal cleavage/methylation domain-containing protein
MPKVELEPMPTLETGKSPAGFTLLEVVAVITLVGLIMALTYPRINHAVEQVEVGYIGRLVKTDLNQIRDESASDPSSEMVVTFTKDGYSFAIGDHRIIRSFKYQFTFELPEAEQKENVPTPTGAADATSRQPESLETSADQNENAAGTSYDIHVVNGVCSDALQLQWKTNYFQGSLLWEKAGAIVWTYQKK